MVGLVGSSSRIRYGHNILILAVVQCVLVSQFHLTIGTSKSYQEHRFELEGSIARYRHLLRLKDSIRHVLQENENEEVAKNQEPENKLEQVQVELPYENRKEQQLHEPQPEGNENADNPQQQQSEEWASLHENIANSNAQRQDSSENVELPTNNENWDDNQESDKKVALPENKENWNAQQQESGKEGELNEDNEDSNKHEQESEKKIELTEKDGDSSDQPQPEENAELSENSNEQLDGNSSNALKITEDEEQDESFVYPEPYLLGVPIKNWDERRARWLDVNPQFKRTSEAKPRVLIVTGSQPEPCQSPVGDNFHVKALKNKIDYARMHNYEIYYNFVWLDRLFGSYWVKLPVLRNLMLTHPEIEWFFWVDSDAVFTDLLFEAPFEAYDSDGTNMVLWGMPDRFFTERNWITINAGVFLIRNCQWSFDLLDKWSPMGPEGPVRDAYGKMLTKFLTARQGNYPADDQSALAYLLLTDEEVTSKVRIVENEYKISNYWVSVHENYETLAEKYHPGLGDSRWPWITHFTGCSPCAGGNNPMYSYEMCMESFETAYIFADNQVLAYMGFQHESLKSQNVIRTKNETDKPLEWLTVNPWAERIAQVAAESTT